MLLWASCHLVHISARLRSHLRGGRDRQATLSDLADFVATAAAAVVVDVAVVAAAATDDDDVDDDV